MRLHRGVQISSDSEAVLEHDGTYGLDATLDRFEPGSRALQAISGAYVVHEEAVDRSYELLRAQVLGEQLRVAWRETAVAADVHVPALVRRDDADVLAARFSALAGAARHGELELVRGTEAAIAELQVDRQSRRVLHSVA